MVPSKKYLLRYQSTNKSERKKQPKYNIFYYFQLVCEFESDSNDSNKVYSSLIIMWLTSKRVQKCK
jgi:hypothetical protein